MKIYAIYKGDRFIDVGTAKELAERHNTTVKTIHWYAGSNRWKNKENKKGLIIFPLDEEEE